MHKEYQKDKLLEKINLLKKNGAVIGFTNGCFDLLHKGHIHSISHAKKKCDFLIVAINSDKSVKLLKGSQRPIDNERIRIKNLSSINDVDAVIVFSEETPIGIINYLLPNILFKGTDYKFKKVVGSDIVLKNGGKIEFIKMLKGISTTKIIKNSSN
ncbi:MAG: adenylyltransferase/cytidyltransferase family protein [Candidatus Pelagibacterales bacterium]